ncbi:hypothetical protein AX16_008691 [Volvariella volvacea WC 439]|nr:hypothetical protein AX16_008691 [Volvariella volvacea WC 439]
MPIAGTVEPSTGYKPYFRSLDELDEWADTPVKKLEGVLPYVPRKNKSATDSKGKLLVCHDYKGGYTESPFSLVYTYQYWSICETFIYFSHYRIAIPPPAWINAAHRQGSKMLGVIIFEPGGEADCLRLVIGNYPDSTNRPPTTTSFPLSDHYAKVLADLAYQRGFDGYLLNWECWLDEGANQARATAAWMTILQSELEKKVGPHAETIWYDSVTTFGFISYQNRLDAYNLPFFLSSTGLFTNYSWWPAEGSSTRPKGNVTYFNNLPPALTGNTPTSQPEVARKQVNDVYIGIDVWGRGTFHVPGFGIYQALTHIGPQTFDLSVAVFAPGWTWETRENDPGWTWEAWWGLDHALWTGSGSEPGPGDPELPPGQEGPFVPVSNFFAILGAPDPIDLPHHTTFSPGVGRSWFVNGVKVFQSANGWADIDKQTSVGDLLWPLSRLAWHNVGETLPLPHTETGITMDDAFNGGSAVRIRIFHNLSHVISSRQLWVPIQSVALTPLKTYEASIVYKVEQPTALDQVTFSLSAKPLGTTVPAAVISVAPKSATTLGNGWNKLVVTLTPPLIQNDTKVLSGLGFLVSTTGSANLAEISVLVGQINAYASLSTDLAPITPQILWAKFKPTTEGTGQSPAGALTWAVGSAVPIAEDPFLPIERTSTWKKNNPILNDPRIPLRYRLPSTKAVATPASTSGEGATGTGSGPGGIGLGGPVRAPPIVSPEDNFSAWKLQPSNDWYPDFLYANIYVTRFASGTPPPSGSPESAQLAWVGTSGLDGKGASFVVVGENLPAKANPGLDRIRFWVQGVTSRGEVLGWDKCAFVDVAA